jgi:hypothetical protein
VESYHHHGHVRGIIDADGAEGRAANERRDDYLWRLDDRNVEEDETAAAHAYRS